MSSIPMNRRRFLATLGAGALGASIPNAPTFANCGRMWATGTEAPPKPKAGLNGAPEH